MEQEQFYELALQPGFSDEMVFQLSTENLDPEATFSLEGFDGITLQMKLYMMARTYSRLVATGKPVKKLRVNVSLEWEHEDEEDIGPPWWSAIDHGPSLTTIDGLSRYPLTKD